MSDNSGWFVRDSDLHKLTWNERLAPFSYRYSVLLSSLYHFVEEADINQYRAFFVGFILPCPLHSVLPPLAYSYFCVVSALFPSTLGRPPGKVERIIKLR